MWRYRGEQLEAKGTQTEVSSRKSGNIMRKERNFTATLKRMPAVQHEQSTAVLQLTFTASGSQNTSTVLLYQLMLFKAVCILTWSLH
jgi:hypothetical protein